MSTNLIWCRYFKTPTALVITSSVTESFINHPSTGKFLQDGGWSILTSGCKDMFDFCTGTIANSSLWNRTLLKQTGPSKGLFRSSYNWPHPFYKHLRLKKRYAAQSRGSKPCFGHRPLWQFGENYGPLLRIMSLNA